MQKLSGGLVNLAWELVNDGKDKLISLDEGQDRQGELNINWTGKSFDCHLIIFSDPHTTGGWYLDPPETTWREEEDKFETAKIREVVKWLADEWYFDLEKEI